MNAIILSLTALSAVVHLGIVLYAIWVVLVGQVRRRSPWSLAILGLGIVFFQRAMALAVIFQRQRDDRVSLTTTDLLAALASTLFALLLFWSIVRIVDLLTTRYRNAETAVQRAAHLELISRISFLVNTAAGLDQILQVLVDELARALDVDSVALALMDESEQYAKVVAEYLAPGIASGLGDKLPVAGNPIAQTIADTRSPVIVKDVPGDPRLAPVREIVQRRGTQSLLVLPLLYQDRIIGTVGLDAMRAPRDFTSQEIELVQTVSNYAAIAIERSRLFQAARDRIQMTEALSRTAEILTSTLDINRVLELVLESLGNIVPCDSSAIFLREGDWLVLTAGHGFPESVQIDDFAFQISDSALEPVLTQEGRPMVISDVLESDLFRKAEGSDYIRSWIGAPLWARGKLVGLLTVDHSQPDIYDAQDAQKVMSFANQAAIVIENARLFEEQVVLAEELEARNKELIETQQKLIEAERLAVIGQVGLTMRHEINNPLTSVMGLAQWIISQHPELPPDVLDDLKTIERMAVRIRDIVSKLGEAKYRTITYMDNVTMLDLHGDQEEDEEEKDRGSKD
jgi:GAF domain-containing protein